MLCFQVIGSNDVAVPTHLFKVIIAESKADKQPQVAAFVLPNQPIAKERSLREFQVPLDFVESKSGVQMLPTFDSRNTRNLCTSDTCQLRPWQEFELFSIQRNISNARNMQELDSAWSELAKNNMQPDKKLTACYNVKKNELHGVAKAA